MVLPKNYSFMKQSLFVLAKNSCPHDATLCGFIFGPGQQGVFMEAIYSFQLCACDHAFIEL